MISRPDSIWKLGRNGSRGGVVQSPPSRPNWYHPFLWHLIKGAGPKADWSATKIVRELQGERYSHFFDQLSTSTVWEWLSVPDRKSWSQDFLDRGKLGRCRKPTGRAGILDPHPDIICKIVDQLTGLRSAGVSVNVVVARAIILAVIKSHKPDLLKSFVCSEV